MNETKPLNEIIIEDAEKLKDYLEHEYDEWSTVDGVSEAVKQEAKDARDRAKRIYDYIFMGQAEWKVYRIKLEGEDEAREKMNSLNRIMTVILDKAETFNEILGQPHRRTGEEDDGK